MVETKSDVGINWSTSCLNSKWRAIEKVKRRKEKRINRVILAISKKVLQFFKSFDTKKIEYNWSIIK